MLRLFETDHLSGFMALPYGSLSSLYAELDQIVPKLREMLELSRRDREYISRQKYQTAYLIEQIKFYRQQPEVHKKSIESLEEALREVLNSFKANIETFNTNARKNSMAMTLILCFSVQNRFRFMGKEGDRIELEEDPFASKGIDMHTGFIDLFQEFYLEIMQSAGLAERVQIRILADNCVCKRPYDQYILMNSFKLMHWFLEGRYEQKKRIAAGIELAGD